MRYAVLMTIFATLAIALTMLGALQPIRDSAATTPAHSVTLTWTGPTTWNGQPVTYTIYPGYGRCGAHSFKLMGTATATNTWTETTDLQRGQTYCYYVTNQSGASNIDSIVVPTP